MAAETIASSEIIISGGKHQYMDANVFILFCYVYLIFSYAYGLAESQVVRELSDVEERPLRSRISL